MACTESQKRARRMYYERCKADPAKMARIREQSRAARKKYLSDPENAERSRRQCAEWRKKNPERMRELLRRWRKEHPGYQTEWARRRKKKTLDVEQSTAAR